MFQYQYSVNKSEFKTTYGSICVDTIVFDPMEIEKALPDIVFKDKNLMHMFAEDNLNSVKRKNIYRRFSPKSEIATDIGGFVEQSIRINKSFYSFLAEGILGLIFRDLYDYSLARGVIDIGETLTDSHTGVDACMYDLKNEIIVLGEAKFYESFSEGINKIIEDLVEKNVKNKLESLQSRVENCEEAYQIVIKNLALENYDELTVDQFMNQKIMFAGFVLHSENDISEYGNQNFYDNHFISTQQLEENIRDSLKHDDIDGDYEIILVHLPIMNKKSLIIKMIETSREMIRNM